MTAIIVQLQKDNSLKRSISSSDITDSELLNPNEPKKLKLEDGQSATENEGKDEGLKISSSSSENTITNGP